VRETNEEYIIDVAAPGMISSQREEKHEEMKTETIPAENLITNPSNAVLHCLKTKWRAKKYLRAMPTAFFTLPFPRKMKRK
jgi:hypothetical protein